MPWNGSGSFIRTNGVFSGGTVWDQSATAGRLIFSDDHDIHDEDIATGLENTVTRDGQNVPTADLSMGGFKHTNVGNATARNQYAVTGQVQDNAYNYATSVGGTADAITITVSPAISAYAEGQFFFFKPSSNNTGATTLSVSGLAATAIKYYGNDLRANDLKSGEAVGVFYDGGSFQLLDVEVITTQGDLVQGDADGSPEALAIGSDGQALIAQSGKAAWGASPSPPNYIYGLEISNNSTLPNTDIDFTAGGARSDDNTADIVAAALTKKLNANFTAGDEGGMLDTGTVAANSVYNLYAIDGAGKNGDYLAVKKGGTPSLPTGYTVKRFIGRIPTDGSSNITADQITQQRIDGQYYDAYIDTGSGTTKTVRAMMDGPDEITLNLNGVSCDAVFSIQVQIGGDTSIEVTGYRSFATNLAGNVSSTTAYLLNTSTAATLLDGVVLLNRENAAATSYVLSTSLGGNAIAIAGGSKTLSGQVLTAMDISPDSGNFDAGSIRVAAFRAGAYAP